MQARTQTHITHADIAHIPVMTSVLSKSVSAPHSPHHWATATAARFHSHEHIKAYAHTHADATSRTHTSHTYLQWRASQQRVKQICERAHIVLITRRLQLSPDFIQVQFRWEGKIINKQNTTFNRGYSSYTPIPLLCASLKRKKIHPLTPCTKWFVWEKVNPYIRLTSLIIIFFDF